MGTLEQLYADWWEVWLSVAELMAEAILDYEYGPCWRCEGMGV